MSEFEDKLNSILSSPKDMEKIMELAKSLSGEAPPKEERRESPDCPDGGLDPKMLGMMTRLMRGFSSPGDDKKLEILRVMRPYLKKERQESLKRGVEMAKLAKLAKIAMTEFPGGGGDA